MKNTAFDLRYSSYRYIRGDSAKIKECESLFENGILMPNGAACLSLLCQYYKPKSIWYPNNIYCGSIRYLRDFSGIQFDDNTPEFVLYNYPNFAGKECDDIREKFPNSIIVCDTSINPFVKTNADIEFFSMSKHYTRTEEMLGLIRLTPRFAADLDNLRFLRQNSGFVIYDHQCDALLKHYHSTKKFVEKVCHKAEQICQIVNRKYPNRIFSTGSIIMIPTANMDIDLKEICFQTPFELRPTFGAARTFCSWQVHKSELNYIGKPYIRISVGTDFSNTKIANTIFEIIHLLND